MGGTEVIVVLVLMVGLFLVAIYTDVRQEEVEAAEEEEREKEQGRTPDPEPLPDPEEAGPPGEPTVLTIVSSRNDASLLLGRLKREGIPAELEGGGSNVFGESIPGQVKVIVGDRHLKEAEEILQELEEEREEEPEEEPFDEEKKEGWGE